MKNFFREYSYSIIKMCINQLAISIFGVALALTAFQNDTAILLVSVFAVFFYLFLIYNMTWEIGAKDRISVDTGRKKYAPHLGLLMSLVANSVNLLLAVIYTVGFPFASTHEWAGSMNAVVKVIAMLTEGMYMGIISVISVLGQALNYYWWTYFLITIPVMLTSWLAYYLGFKNFKFFKALSK